MAKKRWGNTAGSIAAYRAMYQAQPASADFHSNAYENGDQKLFDQCVAEEKAEQERVNAPIRAAQETLNKTFITAQANELLTLPNDPFLAENCTQTEKPNTDEGIRNAFLVFRDVMLPAVITDAGIELLGRVTELNPRVDWASTSPLTFHTVWSRLVSLGLVTEGTHYTGRPERTLAPPQALERELPLNDREQCEAEYVNVVLPLMADWESSLLEQWGVTLTPRLRETVADIMAKHNLNPALTSSYDFVRVKLALRGLITTSKTDDGRPLTHDEFISDAIDRHNIDLGTPAGREWYSRAMDRLLHSEAK